jgi:hypothetical protein
MKNSFIEMSPAKRERLGVLLQMDDVEYIRRNVSRSVLAVQKASYCEDLFNYEEADKEVSDYVEQIERNLDLELRAESEISILTIMKSNKFLLIYLMSIFQMMYPLYFDVVFKEIGQFYIKEDETLTLIGSVSFASNSLFKLITGVVLEFVPAKKVNAIILTTMFITLVTLQYTV